MMHTDLDKREYTMSDGKVLPMPDYQYKVANVSQLEQLTAAEMGWEFVELIQSKGRELLMQEHPQYTDPNGCVQYPPSTVTGNTVTWSLPLVLLRRPIEIAKKEARIAELEAALKESGDVVEKERKEHAEAMKLKEVAHKSTTDHAVEMEDVAKELKEKHDKLAVEHAALKANFNTVELDVGKREMDRILGRYPDPEGIDLGQG